MTCDYCERIVKNDESVFHSRRCGDEAVLQKTIHAEDIGLDGDTEVTGLFPYETQLCFKHKNKKITFEMIKANDEQLTEIEKIPNLYRKTNSESGSS